MSVERALSKLQENVNKLKQKLEAKDGMYYAAVNRMEALLVEYPDDKALLAAKKKHEEFLKLIQEMEGYNFKNIDGYIELQRKIEKIERDLIKIRDESSKDVIRRDREKSDTKVIAIDCYTRDFSTTLSQIINIVNTEDFPDPANFKVIQGLISDRGYKEKTLNTKISEILSKNNNHQKITEFNGVIALLKSQNKPLIASHLTDKQRQIMMEGCAALIELISNMNNYLGMKGDVQYPPLAKAKNDLMDLQAALGAAAQPIPDSLKKELPLRYRTKDALDKLKIDTVFAHSLLNPLKEKYKKEAVELDHLKASAGYFFAASGMVSLMNTDFKSFVVEDYFSDNPKMITDQLAVQKEKINKWQQEIKSLQIQQSNLHKAVPKSPGESKVEMKKQEMKSAIDDLAIMQEQIKRLNDLKNELKHNYSNQRSIMDKYKEFFKQNSDYSQTLREYAENVANQNVKNQNRSCELFLMESPPDDSDVTKYRTSDNLHLYLYKNNDELYCYVSSAEGVKKVFIEPNGVLEIQAITGIKNLSFDQKMEAPVKCDNAYVVGTLLAITASRGLTTPELKEGSEQFNKLVKEEANKLLVNADARMQTLLTGMSKDADHDDHLVVSLVKSVDEELSRMTANVAKQKKAIAKLDQELSVMTRDSIKAVILDKSVTVKEKVDLVFEQVKFELTSSEEIKNSTAKLTLILHDISQLQKRDISASEKINLLNDIMHNKEKYGTLANNPAFRDIQKEFFSYFKDINQEIKQQYIDLGKDEIFKKEYKSKTTDKPIVLIFGAMSQYFESLQKIYEKRSELLLGQEYVDNKKLQESYKRANEICFDIAVLLNKANTDPEAKQKALEKIHSALENHWNPNNALPEEARQFLRDADNKLNKPPTQPGLFAKANPKFAELGIAPAHPPLKNPKR